MKATYIFFSFLLLIAVFYLFLETLSLKEELNESIAKADELSSELDNANEEISGLNASLRETQTELNATREALSNSSAELNLTKEELAERNEELQATEEELNQTLDLLEGTRDEFLQLKEDILDIEESINASIQWFRDNSMAPSSLDYFMARTKAKCVDDRDLNLGCVPFVMEDRLGFVYKREYPDRLYSIEEMVSNRGGDCEDYSLFLKAFLNSFKEIDKGVKLKGWVESPGSEFFIYETSERYWYYEGEEVYFGFLRDLEPYVICYTTEYNPPLIEGHCIIVLSEDTISSADELVNIDGSVTFEPQDGRYKGVVGEDFHLCREGEILCDTNVNSIFFVITNDDLYQFIEGEWKNYRLYQQSASDFGENIDDVIGRLH
jgi:hypothetical protein